MTVLEMIPNPSKQPPDFRGRKVQNQSEGSFGERQKGEAQEDAPARAVSPSPPASSEGLGSGTHNLPVRPTTAPAADSTFHQELLQLPAVHKL